jgi:hypothetical protein
MSKTEVKSDKTVKDYLHLYIGCDVRIARPSGLSVEKFTAARLHELHTILDKSWDLHKPILRPLSDLKNDEIIQLVKILLSKEDVHVVIDRGDQEDSDFILATYNTVYPENDFDRGRFDILTMQLTISNIRHPFSIQNNWNYTKGNSTGVSNEELHNCHEMTRYLLSRGFDLFNLIPEGLAIDKTKLSHD